MAELEEQLEEVKKMITKQIRREPVSVTIGPERVEVAFKESGGHLSKMDEGQAAIVVLRLLAKAAVIKYV